ncbi:MAG: DUF2029 domain-containing protein [Anaerolineae bacterium]|nr:DUF2029 domain-containing protein [Anaerolineae bacterium]
MRDSPRGALCIPVYGQVIILTLALLLLFFTIYILPTQGDWDIFYEAARHPLAPYDAAPDFFNSVWMIWILAPFALLPRRIAGALWIFLSVVLTVWCIRKLKGERWAILLCLLSPAFIRFITAGQLDAVPLLGFVLSLTASRSWVRGIGFVLMATKPQILGGGALVTWIGLKAREKAIALLPLLAVLLLSFLIHGTWPLDIHINRLNQTIDCTPWPYGIPVGLALMAWAIKRRQPEIGAVATYFLVPYLSPSSLFVYTAVLFSIAPRWLSIVVFLLMWVIAAVSL